MIIEEFLEGGTLVHHFSSRMRKVRQVETGIIYDDAVDGVPCPYTYEETEEPIEGADVLDDLAEAARILLGVIE